MILFVPENGFPHIFIVLQRSLNKLMVYLRVLWEYLAHESFLWDWICLDLSFSYEDKLRLLVMKDVVISKVICLVQEIGTSVSLLLAWLLECRESNGNSSFHDEVHLLNLLLFIIDHIFRIIFILSCKFPRFKTKRQIKQESTFIVFLWLEELPKILENVIE